MSERLAGARDALSKNYEEMHAFMASLTEEQLSAVAPNGWTVRRVAGHIATSADGQLFVLGRLRNGKSASFPAFLHPVIDLRNWWTGRPWKNATKADILAKHEEKHNELFSYLNTLTEDDLDKRGPALSMGELSIIEFLHRSSEHEHEHAAEIRQAIGA